MALDPYAPCPGGTGKKVKFCCSDLVSDLEKIDRMIEADQSLAALDYVQKLEQKVAGRACLMTWKTLLDMRLRRMPEAQASSKSFLEAHPQNPTALAFAAILTDKGVAESVALLQQAIELSQNEMSAWILQALDIVAVRLVGQELVHAARKHWELASLIDPQDNTPQVRLAELDSSQSLSPFSKDDHDLIDKATDNRAQKPLEEVLDLANQGHWMEAEKKLTDLGKRFPEDPTIWNNLAVVRTWLARPDAADAWRKLATLDQPWDDAVEAEAMAQMLDSKPNPHDVAVVMVEYPIRDVERLMAHMASDKRVHVSPVDPRSMTRSDEPPPKAMYIFLDRPATDDADVDLKTTPQVIGRSFLYGKQTDRDALLAVVADRPDLERVQTLLREVAKETIGDPEPEQAGQSRPAITALLQPRFYVTNKTTQEQYQKLVDEYLNDVIYRQWPELPNAAVDGKTPHEAAKDPANKLKLSAAVLLLEQLLFQHEGLSNLNRLRADLQLSEAGLIDPWSTKIDFHFPLSRLPRLQVDKLTDEELAVCFRRAVDSALMGPLERMARDVVARDAEVLKPLQPEAYMVLVREAKTIPEQLALVDKGRAAAEALGESSGPWDLQEMWLHIGAANMPEAQRLLRHLSTEHSKEPMVRQALEELAMAAQSGRMGPGAMGPGGMGAPGMAPMGAPAPQAPPQESSGIWTPDSAQAQSGSKPAIWTPGME